ncbi:MAG TPA: hypothetical protein VI172_17225 [Candidatus Dormibacteraeota bacterium]
MTTIDPAKYCFALDEIYALRAGAAYEATVADWEQERHARLAALSRRLPPDLAELLPAITEAAQTAVEESLRRDGTLGHPDSIGERIAHAVGPILEHGPRGGWCACCGTSAIVDNRLCPPCLEDAPCGP